ncbi:hypothetical protein ONE63_011515 [Megalurothrips usitatus]|uniref:Uncharacterized protein n=1 Tax=Megalurothrips usitatus TaxID=439358 RepID=A0AAV7WZ31_9NEOP|nr:hypothetical protein ONE63_011515 [Megalurothrips usitatus]
MKRDFRAKSHIVFSVGSAALKYVRGSTTAFEAWQRLCAAIEDKGVHRRLALLDQLLDARQANYSSLENYVYGVKEIVTKIQETGKPIEDGLSAMKLLKGLNAEYKWLRQLIERTRTIPDGSGDTILAFDTVVEELLRGPERGRREVQQGRRRGARFKHGRQSKMAAVPSRRPWRISRRPWRTSRRPQRASRRPWRQPADDTDRQAERAEGDGHRRLSHLQVLQAVQPSREGLLVQPRQPPIQAGRACRGQHQRAAEACCHRAAEVEGGHRQEGL